MDSESSQWFLQQSGNAWGPVTTRGKEVDSESSQWFLQQSGNAWGQ